MHVFIKISLVTTDVTMLASQTDPGLVAKRLVNGNMFMEEPVGSVLGKVVSAQHNRSSSASRGRGLNRAKKDLLKYMLPFRYTKS